jgi:hypothetical protein
MSLIVPIQASSNMSVATNGKCWEGKAEVSTGLPRVKCSSLGVKREVRNGIGTSFSFDQITVLD